MRFSIIKTVFLKELREMLRDRRSLAIMFGIPLLLYPLLTIAVAGLGMQRQKQRTETKAKLVVLNPASAPHLLELIRDKEKDRGIVLDPSVSPQTDLSTGKIDAIIDVPPDAERDLLTGKAVEL